MRSVGMSHLMSYHCVRLNNLCLENHNLSVFIASAELLLQSELMLVLVQHGHLDDRPAWNGIVAGR